MKTEIWICGATVLRDMWLITNDIMLMMYKKISIITSLYVVSNQILINQILQPWKDWLSTKLSTDMLLFKSNVFKLALPSQVLFTQRQVLWEPLTASLMSQVNMPRSHSMYVHIKQHNVYN